jgi:hypothetical protein
MSTIRDSWDKYKNFVYPQGMSREQCEHIKKAYLAGVVDGHNHTLKIDSQEKFDAFSNEIASLFKSVLQPNLTVVPEEPQPEPQPEQQN